MIPGECLNVKRLRKIDDIFEEKKHHKILSTTISVAENYDIQIYEIFRKSMEQSYLWQIYCKKLTPISYHVKLQNENA